MRIGEILALGLVPLLAAACATGTGPKQTAAQPAPLTAEAAAKIRRAGAEVLFWDQEQRDRNFRVDVGHVSLFGVCGDCKEQP